MIELLQSTLPIFGSSVQVSALVELQLRVDELPSSMVAGAVLTVTVGSGTVTVTVVETEAEPPEPVAIKVYSVVSEGEASKEPLS